MDRRENLARRRYARVGADQQFFELVPDLVIDLATVEEAGYVAEPTLAGLLKRLFGLLVGLFRALEDTYQGGASSFAAILSGQGDRVKRTGTALEYLPWR